MNNGSIIKAVTGYTSSDGRNYRVVLNEALWILSMVHSLSNPNQLRAHGINMQNNPYDREPMIVWTMNNKFCACLDSQGATIFINTWSPTIDDLAKYPYITLTYDRPWILIDTKMQLDQLIMMHTEFPCFKNLQVHPIFFHHPRVYHLTC